MTKTRYPPRLLLFAWLGLLALLASTVAIAYAPLGAANTVIALAIAAIKAGLVAGDFHGTSGPQVR